jgi:flagellar biosynthesis/type III secretory pathway protein FliH
MTIATIFEDFSQDPVLNGKGSSSVEELEAYETGYKAGWEDAKLAHQTSKSHLSTALIKNVEQIQFSAAEIRAETLGRLNCVLTEVFEKLFPALRQESLRGLLEEELSQLLHQHATNDIELIVSPDDQSVLSTLIEETDDLKSIRIAARPDLTPGQAFVCFGNQKSKVDVQHAVSHIRETVLPLLTNPPREQAHVS